MPTVSSASLAVKALLVFKLFKVSSPSVELLVEPLLEEKRLSLKRPNVPIPERNKGRLSNTNAPSAALILFFLLVLLLRNLL